MTFAVISRAQVRAAVAEIERHLGPVQVLINKAGVASDLPFEPLPEESWHRDIAVSLDGAMIYVPGSAAGQAYVWRIGSASHTSIGS